MAEKMQIFTRGQSMKRIAGLKQVHKAVENGTALKVYVALDADARLIDELTVFAGSKGVPVATVETMAELGKLAGIKVPSATAADICD